jgi:hypothetical protein
MRPGGGDDAAKSRRRIVDGAGERFDVEQPGGNPLRIDIKIGAFTFPDVGGAQAFRAALV